MGGPSKYLESLIREFVKLPGIGPKSASRLAFHLLKQPYESAESLVQAIVDLKKNIVTCTMCGGISDAPVCSICSDPSRDAGLMCVVEGAKDVLTIESLAEYRGLYHVLNGLISPLDGIGPDELTISSFLEKCKSSRLREIILALNPTIEGDATSLYIARLIAPLEIKVTRIAHGLPVGSDLEFIDGATIMKSFEGRVRL